MTDTSQPNDDETIDVELVAGDAASNAEPDGPITAFNAEPAGPITAFNAEPEGSSSASAEELEGSFYEAEDGAGSPDGGE